MQADSETLVRRRGLALVDRVCPIPALVFAISLLTWPLPAQGQAGPSRAAAPKSEPSDPLDPGQVMLAGSPGAGVVGRIDDQTVTMRDLDRQSVGAFMRIGRVVHDAREKGYRWLIERTALETQARGRRLDLAGTLREEYRRLADPTDADLEPFLKGDELAHVASTDKKASARSRWRWQRWRSRRASLVEEGLGRVRHERFRLHPFVTEPASAVVAKVDGRPLTLRDMQALGGFRAEEARREYYETAKVHFDRFSTRTLIEREAERVGLTVKQLKEAERARAGAVSEEEIRSLLAREPSLADGKHGYERAKDHLRRMRSVEADESLVTRLRTSARIEFLLTEPEDVPIPLEIPHPRTHGDPRLPNVFVALHGLGCESCAEGSRLIERVFDRYRTSVRLVSGDSFADGDFASYWGGLALHCANAQGRFWPLFGRLKEGVREGAVPEIVNQAKRAGLLEADFEACLAEDRFLPEIFENRAFAQRLGIDDAWPGLFMNGVRLINLNDPDDVIRQAGLALRPSSPSREE